MTLKQSIESTEAKINLTKALTETVSAKTRFDVLVNEKGVHEDTRKLLKIVSNRLGKGLDVFRNGMPDDYRKMFEETILDMDISLQLDNIHSMLLDLPPGIRDQIESYVTSQYNVYGKTK